MLKKLGDHARGNAVGYVALFFALGGTTAWAVDGPLAGQNTVGSEDIIGNEIKSGDIANGRIFNVDIADDAIQSDKVRADTLTGDDINEATLSGLQRPLTSSCAVREAIAHFNAGGVPICIETIGDLVGDRTNEGGETTGGDPCVMSQVDLFAGRRLGSDRLPANGQLLPIDNYLALFSLLGTTYGGDGQNTFALPDLRKLAPNDMTYGICANGFFP